MGQETHGKRVQRDAGVTRGAQRKERTDFNTIRQRQRKLEKPFASLEVCCRITSGPERLGQRGLVWSFCYGDVTFLSLPSNLVQFTRALRGQRDQQRPE